MFQNMVKRWSGYMKAQALQLTHCDIVHDWEDILKLVFKVKVRQQVFNLRYCIERKYYKVWRCLTHERLLPVAEDPANRLAFDVRVVNWHDFHRKQTTLKSYLLANRHIQKIYCFRSKFTLKAWSRCVDSPNCIDWFSTCLTQSLRGNCCKIP